MNRARHLAAALLLAGGAAHAETPLAGALAQWDRDDHPDLRAVVVLRHGAVIAERYYNGETADTLHDVRSAGKSITALLAGAAADRGKLSAAGKVGQYWPASRSSAIADATLDNVLTMRSGLDSFDEDPASPGNEDKMDDAADPVAFALAIPRQTAPGTHTATTPPPLTSPAW
jgi:CubicO group peptidase (beta-lactamase class C family)